MSNLTLNLDQRAEESIEKLRRHYGASSKAEIIRKALALLMVAAEVQVEKGHLIARKKDKGIEKETVIVIS